MSENSRRSFLKQAGMQTAALTLFPWISMDGAIEIPEEFQNLPIDDDDFWSRIQEAYSVSRSWINLNNGGVSPQPIFVQDAFKRYMDISNEAPSYYMWRRLEPTRVNIRTDLANLLGCDRDEIVINRNTTEALDTVIFGLDLKKGDEVVLSKYDYPNMRNAWEQRQKRDGIVLKYVDFVLPDSSEDEIVQAYVKQISNKTKLVHLTHMVNYNGQVMPVEDIAKEVKKRDILLMLDGAHSFAHIDFNVRELQCDFFATSLHKWMCAPFGTGLLYIKKDLISTVWAFSPTKALKDDDIRKFEAMGTRSVPAEIAVGQAVIFHNNIGITRKSEKLKSLTDYWTEALEEESNFISYTPKRSGKYASLYTFGIKGMKANEISNLLQSKYSIISTTISWENIEGCRISPHVYTTQDELDKLIEGIKYLLKA